MRTCVVVLGMHRSGTSALTGLLSLLGVHPGIDLMPANEFNPKGYWELQPVVQLNEELLARLGRLWDDVMPLPPNWTSLPAISELMPRAEEIITRELSQSKLSLLKDPRLCLLLPFWADCLAAKGFESKYIVMVRLPGETAASLNWRYQFSSEKSAWLWLRHMLDAEQSTRGKTRLFVSFDELLADWRVTVTDVSKALDLQVAITPDVAEAVEAFLDPQLRHFHKGKSKRSKVVTNGKALPGFCAETYALMSNAAARDLSKEEMVALDRVRERFETWSADHIAAEIPREQAWTRSVVLALNDRVATMQTAAVAADAQIASQGAKLEEMELARVQDAASLHDIQQRNDALAADVSVLTQKSASLEAEVKHANERNEALSNDVSLLTRQSASLEAELKHANERHEGLSNDVSLLTQQRTSLEADLERANERMDALVAEAAVLTRQSTNLAAEVERASARNAELEARLGELTEQRAKLEAQLGAVKERENATAGQLAASIERRHEIESRLNTMNDRSKSIEGCLRESLAFHRRSLSTAGAQGIAPVIVPRDEAAREGIRFACERPENREPLTGRIDIAGWCFGTTSQVVGVELFWNGTRLMAQYGGLRGDVAQAHPQYSGAAASEFRCSVEAQPGDYFLSMVALCDDGQRVQLGDGVIGVRPVPLQRNLDTPMLAGLNEETTRFSGWCFSRDQAILSLVLHVGNSRFPCEYGLRREDLAAIFPGVVYAGLSGFECDVALVPGRFDIKIEASLASGVKRVEMVAHQVRVRSVFDLKRALQRQRARIGRVARTGRLALLWMRRQRRIPRWHELPSLLRKVRTQLRIL